MHRRWIAVFLAVIAALPLLASRGKTQAKQTAGADYIRYVEFNVPRATSLKHFNDCLRI